MKCLIVALVIVFVLAPRDVPDQCDQPVFARANPALCFPGFPFGQAPGGGGGGSSDGGLLGGIGRVLHGLTGGLL